MMASDESTCAEVIATVLPLLASPNIDVRVQGLLTLGSVVKYAERNGPWMFKPSFNNDFFEPILPLLRSLINSDHPNIASACWALAYISFENDEIEAVIDGRVCRRLVQLLLKNPACLKPVLVTFSSIASGNHLLRQHVIDCRLLPILRGLMANEHNKSIKTRAICIIAQVTQGHTNQIQAVIDENIIPVLILKNFEANTLAARAIVNVLCGGSRQQIQYMASEGCIEKLCDMLNHFASPMISLALDGLRRILNAGKTEKGINVYARHFEKVYQFEKFEELQHHHDNAIRSKTTEMLLAHWGAEYLQPRSSSNRPAKRARHYESMEYDFFNK